MTKRLLMLARSAMRKQKVVSMILICVATAYAYGSVNITGGAINIPATNQNGNLQSSAVTASGISGSISQITVTLNNWTDSNGDTDREFMLVFQPTGCGSTSCEQTFQFAGGVGLGSSGSGISGVTVTFADSATNHAPGLYDGDPSNNATYKPTVNNVETTCSDDGNGAAFGGGAPFAVAPCATYNTADSNDGPSEGTATFASQFSGTADGTWTLYVWTNSEVADNSATIASWTLSITTANATNTSTALSSNATNNETTEATFVTFTATVSPTPDGGTVTFTDNGANLSCSGGNPVAVSGGTATCTTSFSTEGNHPLEAAYNGDADFGTSHGTLNFFVDHPTSNPTPGAYCNTGTITINTNTSPGTTPYPQHITIPSTGFTISDVSLTLNSFSTDSNGAISDYNFLLVDPNGHKFIPLAGTGGQTVATNVTFTLSDVGSSPVPNPTGSATSGTYLPTDDNSGLSFPSGTPSGPYQLPQNQGGATFDSTFGGASPSGQWSLYVYDTSGQQTGSIGGYCLSITTSNAAATTTTVTASPNGEATTGTQVTFTATVKSGGNPISSGTVTFKENGTVLSGPTTLNGSGQASFQTSSLAEGIHTITANYSGVTETYQVSSGQVSIEIDNATTNPSAGVYCNSGSPSGITISASDNSNIPATPYPSRVDVTNLAGTVNTVGVSLNNFSTAESESQVMLLEGPTATNIVFWNGVGNGDDGFSGLNVTIADSAGSGNPIPAPPVNNQTYYPTSDQDGVPNPAFPAPAPTSLSYAPSMGAQTFTTAFGANGGINGNGYWSLFIYGRFGQSLSIGNWCLNFGENPPVVTLAKVHNGTFTQGDTGDTYTITVSNPSGPGSTAGTMTLTDTLPPGITATGMSETANNGGGTGSDWTCNVTTTSCARTTPLGIGETDTITLTVNVTYNASTAPNAVMNNVSLSGGGIASSPLTAQDTQTVQPGPDVKADTTTSVTSSANPSVFGQSVTLTATVSPVAPAAGTPTGTVTFLDGGSPIGTRTLSGGVATFTTSTLAAGSHTITSSYVGDVNFNGSTGSMTGNPQVVNKIDTTTTVAVDDAATHSPWSGTEVTGASAYASSTVSPASGGGPAPTGSVAYTLYGNGTCTGGAISTSVESLASGSVPNSSNSPSLPAGKYSSQASYSGDSNYNPSHSNCTSFTVSAAPTSIAVTNVSPSSEAYAQDAQVTITAVLSGAVRGFPPAGPVTIGGNGPSGYSATSCGARSGNTLTCTATYTPTGADTIGSYTESATFSGDSNYTGSSSTQTNNFSITQATSSTSVGSSQNPSLVGQSVTFTATIDGEYGLVVQRNGALSGGGLTLTKKGLTQRSLTQKGQTHPLSAGGINGNVTWSTNTGCGTTPVSGGTSQCTTTTLPQGTDVITTTYNGDNNHSGSTGTLSGGQVVNPATVTVTVGTSPAGLKFSVDKTTYDSAHTFTWTIGSGHSIATTSPQYPSAGTEETWANWSDGGALSHSFKAVVGTTRYTANFNTNYLLTMAAKPTKGGSVAPLSGTYYPASDTVKLSAAPNTNYVFSDWTGNVANTHNAATTITMNAPETVTANFVPAEVIVSPTSISFGSVCRSKKVVITLQNNGKKKVSVGPISFINVAGKPGDFSDIEYCSKGNLNPGSSCTVGVTFSPSEKATESATLNIVTSAPGSPIQVQIKGTGIGCD